MAKRDRAEEALQRLRELEAAEPDDNAVVAVAKFLKDRSNRVAAKAAHLAAEWRRDDLAADLENAFNRFLKNPVKTDPGCTAKLAIVETLTAVAQPAWDVFLAGAYHVQKEPAWGPPIDTAPALRGLCGRALAALGHSDAYRIHALLLTDSEPVTRGIAVETLANVPTESSELLLRMKVLTGDSDPGVLADAFRALMTIAPEDSLELVASALTTEDFDTFQAAALALGESRLPEAFDRLRAAWLDAETDAHREALALPIALIRDESAFDFLLKAVSEARNPVAVAAVEALALFQTDAERSRSVEAAVDARGSNEVSRAFQKAFDRAGKT